MVREFNTYFGTKCIQNSLNSDFFHCEAQKHSNLGVVDIFFIKIHYFYVFLCCSLLFRRNNDDKSKKRLKFSIFNKKSDGSYKKL